MKEYYLGIDIGTYESRGMLIDENMIPVADCSVTGWLKTGNCMEWIIRRKVGLNMMRTKSGGEISVNYAGFFLKRVTFVLTRSDVSGRALLVRTACL